MLVVALAIKETTGTQSCGWQEKLCASSSVYNHVANEEAGGTWLADELGSNESRGRSLHDGDALLARPKHLGNSSGRWKR